MVNAQTRIQVGQVFRDEEIDQNAIVTGFGASQDETTVQLSYIDEGNRGGEFSMPIFKERFAGPLSIQIE